MLCSNRLMPIDTDAIAAEIDVKLKQLLIAGVTTEVEPGRDDRFKDLFDKLQQLRVNLRKARAD